jgi:hypothetical protein
MTKHLKCILLLLIYIGTSYQQSIAGPPTGSTIISAVTLTQSILDGYSWPVTINGGTSGSPLIVTLGEDVTLSNELNYFIINGDYVTFEGNNKTITLSGVSSYLGLINNGNYTANGFNNLTIQNLGVLSNNSSCVNQTGWIGQINFSKNASYNLFTFCYSNGPISSNGGGIVGISAKNCIATNCYSTGTTDIGAGGIFGFNAFNCSAINCYSTGSIGEIGGGIFGYQSIDNISTNCYSTGNISQYGGGIFGYSARNSISTNCYSTGNISQYGGGIFGYSDRSIISTNCYIANGAFSSITANSNLTGTDGTVWNTSFTPYRLSVFPQLKWGLSRYGQKIQDNTIQLDINGKKGTSSPVNENGKVN